MSASSRARYLWRVAAAYLGPGSSQLTFWHDTPTAEPDLRRDELGPYHMRFEGKANYAANLDSRGVPMLNYRGAIGLQYNPIAIAQFALGNHTLWLESGSPECLAKLESASDWLVDNLKPNRRGIPVWAHHFDWEYVERLVAPWYSGLAQGQGISALARAHSATGNPKYIDAAIKAFRSLEVDVSEGGVIFTDSSGDPWIEEYIVSKPTHILNGFTWALWGVHDLYLATRDERAKSLWDRCVDTLARNAHAYDLGWWSLYDQSASGRLPMIASRFYHSLHIVQFRVMSELSGMQLFDDLADRWASYSRNRFYRFRAVAQKALFKLLKY